MAGCLPPCFSPTTATPGLREKVQSFSDILSCLRCRADHLRAQVRGELLHRGRAAGLVWSQPGIAS